MLGFSLVIDQAEGNATSLLTLILHVSKVPINELGSNGFNSNMNY